LKIYKKIINVILISVIFNRKKKDYNLIKGKTKNQNDKNQEMRFCPNCEEKIPYDSGFCPYCTMRFR
jgi:hypothetical protein